METAGLADRVEFLERRVRRLSTVACAAALGLFGVLVAGASENESVAKAGTAREIKATRIVVVDERGRPRVVIGQDPEDTERISRATGITLYDKTGAERGGFSTMADGSVVLGMDAPAGVGAAMRDRIGMRVEATGAASISLINNQTGVPVRLVSEAGGAGGIEFIDYDLAARKAYVKRIHYGGESTAEQSLGG